MRRKIKIIGVILLIIILLGVVKYIKNNNSINENITQYSAGDYNIYLNQNGLKRNYYLHIPPNYNKNIPTPLILNLHGGGGGGKGHQTTSKMNKESDKSGFIVVYPNGMRRDGNSYKLYQRFWNIGEGPNGFYYDNKDKISKNNDIEFIKNILDDLELKLNIDKKRIYLTGLSNGGILSQEVACKFSDKIAAIAPVSAPFWTFPENCNLKRPISVILFQGLEDVCAPYEGGISQCSSKQGISRKFISAQDTLNIWKEKNKCSKQGEITYKNKSVECKTYSCLENSEVSLCTIKDGGHTWPGGTPYSIPGVNIGKTTQDINANQVMWQFFKNHPIK